MSETGFHRHFRPLHRQSDPGSRVNEDGSGLRAGHAWIIDGATGVSGGRSTPGASDAAWLAGTIDAALASLTRTNGSVGSLFRSLETEIEVAFRRLQAASGTTSCDLGPAACLGLLALRPEGKGLRLQGAFLGDVVALVPTADGVVRWTDERAKPFEKRTLAALNAAGRQDPRLVPAAVSRQILENRTQLNQMGGYWVVQPQRRWAGRELTFETEVRTGQPIVLATDGFMRLVDVFGTHTDAGLHAALSEGGGSRLIDELRDLERRDRLAGAYPRVKTHDDASVLVLAVED